MFYERLVQLKSWFAGAGGQDACFEAGDARGDTVFVALNDSTDPKNPSYLYTAFKDIADFFAYYLSFPVEKRSFFSIDRSQNVPAYTSSLYFDLEWKTPKRDPEGPQRLNCLISALRGTIPGLKVSDIKVFVFGRRDDDGMFKNSFHVSVPGVAFADNAEMGEWIKKELWVGQQLINNPLMTHANTKAAEPIIDFSVYTSNRLLRLPGSSKRPGGAVPDGMPQTAQELLEAFSCWFRPVTHSVPVAKKTKKSNKPPRFAPVALSKDKDVCETMEGMLRDRGDHHTRVTPAPKGPGFVGRTDRVHGRVCLVGGEHNASDCCYFNIDHKGQVWYHCYDRDAHAYCAGITLGTLPPSLWSKTNNSRSQPMWSAGITRIEHPEKEGYVKPILFGKKTRVIAIEAHCGRGKSTSVAKCIKRLGEDIKDFRVLVISARISHAAVQKSQFKGFTHYKQANFLEANKLIIQYESLHLLADHDVKAFDLVILDEARSIVDQMLSTETNGRFTGRNARYLYALLGFAETKVIALDADLTCDGCVPTLLQRVARPDEIAFHQYTHNPTVRKFYATRNRQVFMDKLSKEVRSGDKTAIACTTKSAAEAWSQYLQKHRPELKTLLIHGDVDDSLKTSMQTPNDFLAQFDVLIFTSVITVGADVQLPWHNLFVDASSRNGCGARQLLQMAGRFRKLTTPRVDILYPAKPTKADQNYTLQYRLRRAQLALRERESDLAVYQGLIRFEESFGKDGHLTLAPDWFTEIFVHAHAEKMARFEEEFARMAKRHQFEIVMDDDKMKEEAEPEEFKEMRELATTAREEQMKDAFAELHVMHVDDLHQRRQDLDERIKKQEASEAEKIQCEVLHTLKHFRGEIEGDQERNEKRQQLSYERFTLAHKHKRPMFNIAMVLKRGLDHDVVLAPLRNKLRDSDCANLPTASIPYLPAACTLQALDLLGVKDVGLKGQTMFTKTDIIAKRKEIIELTNRAARAGGKQIRSRVVSEKVAKDMAHEPLKGLRSAVESSFNAKIKGSRKRNSKGSQERETYEIVHNKELVDLALISNAYERDTDEAFTSTLPFTTSAAPPPPKKRRTDVAASQTRIVIDDEGIGLA